MKSEKVWSIKLEKNNDPNSPFTNQVLASTLIYDGQILIAAVADALLAYEVVSGKQLEIPLRGYHKETITALASTKDGLKFASGSMDKLVIIWTYNRNKPRPIEAENKYSQSDSIYCIAFSPLKQQIFSGSGGDYALWQPGAPQIEKYKFKDKIISAGWSADGQVLSFGTITGIIVFTDRQASTLKEVQIPKAGPVWCLEWSPITPDFQNSTLIAGVWNNSLFTFDQSGQQIGPKLDINTDPLHINYGQNGEYYAVAGNNNKVQLYTRDGGFLIEACSANDWIWSTKVKNLYITNTTNDGEIFVNQLVSDPVNALHQDRFIQRDQLTDVVIQQMVTSYKARIRCKELVKKVAIYKDKVAVMCGPRIIIYACIIKGEEIMKYKLFKKFTKRIECTWFALSSSNVLVGHQTKLISYNFNGDMDRAWTFESNITAIQMCGGGLKKELILVGLENGTIYKVFLDNSFPVLAHKINQSVKALDISMNKKRIAIIDSNQNLSVIDSITKEVLFGEMGVEGVAFNQQFEDLISFSGKGLLFVKCAAFPTINQRVNGDVIGFLGQKLFLVSGQSIQTIDVQLTTFMQKYIEKKDFANALKIACQGATELDLRNLGIEALVNGEFEIAKRAFVRNKDYNLIDLLLKYEKLKLDPQTQSLLNAEALCYQGRYQDAGNLLLKVGMAEKAIELFTELKRWDDAKEFAKKGDVAYRAQTAQSRAGTGRLGTASRNAVQQPPPIVGDGINAKAQMNKLLKEQAEWTKETGDWKGAADLFLSCQEYKKAIDLYGQNKAAENIVEICRMLDKKDNAENIMLCATYFKKLKHHGGAKEAFLKLNDLKNLMILHIEFEKWQEAFAIGRTNPDLLQLAKIPYAEYLLKNDKYEDALKAYKSAERFDITMKMTQDMSKNCLEEKRFGDASSYLWSLALDCLSQIKNYKDMSGDDKTIYDRYLEYSDTADIYYAYQKINNFIEEPFQPLSGNAYLLQVMNAARFILTKWKPTYRGVKMSYVYYALARTTKALQSYQTARLCYEKLSAYKIPAEWSEEVDLSSLLVRSKSFQDQDIIVPHCQRCNSQNKIISNTPQCSSCLHPYISSFLSFGVLPLVEFKVPDHYTRKQVETLLQQEKQEQKKKDPPFMRKMNEAVEQQQSSQSYVPVEIDANVLGTLSPEEIFIVDFTSICPTFEVKYYKNMVPDIALHNCQFCGRFFYLDEHEFEYVQRRQCPFCRTLDKKSNQKDIFDI